MVRSALNAYKYTHITCIADDADLVSYMYHAPFQGVQRLWECFAPLGRRPEEIPSCTGCKCVRGEAVIVIKR